MEILNKIKNILLFPVVLIKKLASRLLKGKSEVAELAQDFMHNVKDEVGKLSDRMQDIALQQVDEAVRQALHAVKEVADKGDDLAKLSVDALSLKAKEALKAKLGENAKEFDTVIDGISKNLADKVTAIVSEANKTAQGALDAAIVKADKIDGEKDE